MLNHESKVSKNILEWVSESTIEVHKITKEYLCLVIPDKTFDKSYIRGSHLHSVRILYESVGSDLNRRILSDSTPRIEKGTHVELDLSCWEYLVKYEKWRNLWRVTYCPDPAVLTDHYIHLNASVRWCLWKYSRHQDYTSVEVVVQELPCHVQLWHLVKELCCGHVRVRHL